MLSGGRAPSMDSPPSIAMRVHHYARCSRPASFVIASSAPSGWLFPAPPADPPVLGVPQDSSDAGMPGDTPPVRRPDTPLPSYGTVVDGKVDVHCRPDNPAGCPSPAQPSAGSGVNP